MGVRAAVDLLRLTPQRRGGSVEGELVVCSGGALSALAAGGYRPTLAYGAFTSSFGAMLGIGGVVLFAAGMLIGYGARTGGGCTSGHGMCGMALGSPASIVCTMMFMGAAVATANLLALLIGGR